MISRMVAWFGSIGGRLEHSQWFIFAPAIYAVQLGAELVYRFHNGFVHLDQVDFIAFYTGARLFLTNPSLLYSAPAQVGMEMSIIPGFARQCLFVNPPLAAVVLTPLTNWSFPVALAVFQTISILALLVAGVCIVRLFPASLPVYQRALLTVAAIGYGGIENLGQAQWGSLQLLAIVAGLALTQRRPVVGGLLLSTVMVKPQLGLFILPALLLGRHKRPAVGFAIGCSVWALSTLLLVGVSGITAWWATLGLDAAHWVPSSDALPAWTTLFAGETGAVVTSVVLTAGGLILLFRFRGHLRSVEVAVGLALAMALVSATLAHRWDAVLLALPLALIMRRSPGWGLIAAITLGVAVLIPHATGVLIAVTLVGILYHWWQPDSQETVPPVPA